MNNEITQLAVEAGLMTVINGCFYPTCGSAEETVQSLDKFAQLIASRTADICRSRNELPVRDGHEADDGALEIMDRLVWNKS
jgi:hypothetical protein